MTGASEAAATKMTLSSAGDLTLTSTTAATSSTTGSRRVGGGVGIAADLFVGDDFDVTGDAVIDGTALVTGVLTTTAATVFNGGFAAGGVGTFADGSAGAPSITNTGDVNTGIFFPAADKIGLVTGGVERIRLNDIGGVTVTSTAGGHFVVNEGGIDSDFRVESDGNANMLFVDGAGNKVGIGTASPDAGLQIQGADGSVEATLKITSAGVASAGLACDANGLHLGAESGDGFQFRTAATASDPTDTGTVITQITSGGALLVGEIMEQIAGRISQTMVSEDSLLSLCCRSATDGHMPVLLMQKTPATSGNFTATGTGDFLGQILFRGVNTSAVADIGAAIRVKQTSTASGAVPAEMQFFTNEVQRVVLKSNGKIGINDTDPAAQLLVSAPAAGTVPMAINDNQANGTNSKHRISFLLQDSEVGSITASSNGTAFNTSSDYRLKENVNYNWNATTRLQQLKPARFNFISDDSNTLLDGFLAHEVQDVVPEAVTGTKDKTQTTLKAVLSPTYRVLGENIEQSDWTAGKSATTDEDGNAVAAIYPSDSTWEAEHVAPVMQGIDQAKLVPLLVKTIQELESRITALEA